MATELPKTFKQAVFKEHGAPLTIEEVELRMPERGEVLVKVEACGVCHSDTFAQTNAFGGGFPLVPGHEIIGHVAAVADGETAWKVGDRIGGPWHGGHDGTCKACKKGLFQMCDNEKVNGVTRNGGYAQYCTLRSEAGVPIPSHLDAAQYAPILCAGVTVYNSMRRMEISPGSLVAIQGLGGLGHLALQYANKFGFRVAALSRNADKEKFARDLGAHEYIDGSKGDQGEALQKLGGASLIVVTAPDAKVISPLMKGLGIMGKLLILAAAGEVPVDTGPMIHYGLSVHSWPSGHTIDSEEAVAFTELQNIKCMVEKFPLEKCSDAMDAMMKGTVRFRGVITME
ncbi:hypothetical protein GJ744_003310 [Endocarpon pusillum]|uniref:Enoyl reductase (ER) domain-containing protein n=1 Tax=Endocarpon pusillum TaxID=364733 RepID=A0A8H7A7Z0_9EURO|nr:hypothetical protein GJ744_003310 [Endocarpon pusillum]